jgi:hypothetical protein
VQCARQLHLDLPPSALPREEHRGKFDNPAAESGQTVLTWLARDRREYTGEWPGPCTRTPGCILHQGHLRMCAL